MRRARTIGLALTSEAFYLVGLRAFGFAHPPDYARAAERFVATLLRLGPTFVKVGQIMSTRPDFLPREYVASLERLQQGVPSFPFEEARGIVEEALGRDLASAFSSFDETLVAAAGPMPESEVVLLRDAGAIRRSTRHLANG